VGGAPIRPPLGFLSICFGLENPKKVPIPSAFVVFQHVSQCYIVLCQTGVEIGAETARRAAGRRDPAGRGERE